MKNTSSKELLLELYQADYILKDENGNVFEIPESGSLGILALGYRGLIAWRKKKKEIKQKSDQ